MVILDGVYKAAMLTNGSHHYIQPDPFVPISSSMDAKTSPLAMLQRTCSQIGADTSASAKPLITAEKKREEKKDSSSRTSPPASSTSTSGSSSSVPSSTAATSEKPTFKPYDLDRKEVTTQKVTSSPVTSPSGDGTTQRDRKSPGKSPDSRRTSKSSEAGGSGSSPITRPGAEVLAGCGAKELAGLGLHKPGAMPLLSPYLPGTDSASAALRPTLPGLPGLYSQPTFSAASYLGLSPLHRPGEKCASPYCPCAYAASGLPATSGHGYGSACPAGCAQCEHAKALSSLQAPYLGLVNPFYPPSSSSLGLGMAPPVTSASGHPIVCSWMAEGRYCGKRFSTTEELMQHLRTHTNLSASDSALSLIHPAYHASLLGARAPFPVPPSSLSPLSAARYHPYSKPGSSLGLPAPHPSLAAYYSPYSALYARPPTMP